MSMLTKLFARINLWAIAFLNPIDADLKIGLIIILAAIITSLIYINL